MKRTIALVFAILLSIPAAASACGSYGPPQPFENDVRSLNWAVGTAYHQGLLSNWERARAQRQLARVAAMQLAVNRDGVVSYREQRRMERLINRAERLIKRLSGNDVRAVPRVAAR